MLPRDNSETEAPEPVAPESPEPVDAPELVGDEEVALPDKPVSAPSGALVKLSEIELLDNPRGDVGDVAELAESIRVGGLLHPVVVRKSGGDTPYQLVVGYRRYAAHALLEREEIPAVVVVAGDEDVLENVITENLQRRGWSPLAEAKAMQRMIDVLGYSRARVAASLGVHRSQVTKRLALLDLPETVRTMVDEQRISASHAEVLMSLKTSEAQEEMAELAAKSGAPVNKLASWTQKVRAQEEEVEAANEPVAKESKESDEGTTSTETVSEEIVHEALMDHETPMETPKTLVVTPLPRLVVGEWDETDSRRALLYLLLRACNDREVIDYLAHEHGVELAEMWDFVEGSSEDDVGEMIDVMIRRWYRAPHRYPTFPSGLRASLGAGEEMAPPREESPEWSAANSYDFDEWEDDWGDGE